MDKINHDLLVLVFNQTIRMNGDVSYPPLPFLFSKRTKVRTFREQTR